jgi:hypothetical protein
MRGQAREPNLTSLSPIDNNERTMNGGRMLEDFY